MDKILIGLWTFFTIFLIILVYINQSPKQTNKSKTEFRIFLPLVIDSDSSWLATEDISLYQESLFDLIGLNSKNIEIRQDKYLVTPPYFGLKYRDGSAVELKIKEIKYPLETSTNNEKNVRRQSVFFYENWRKKRLGEKPMHKCKKKVLKLLSKAGYNNVTEIEAAFATPKFVLLSKARTKLYRNNVAMEVCKLRIENSDGKFEDKNNVNSIKKNYDAEDDDILNSNVNDDNTININNINDDDSDDFSTINKEQQTNNKNSNSYNNNNNNNKNITKKKQRSDWISIAVEGNIIDIEKFIITQLQNSIFWKSLHICTNMINMKLEAAYLNNFYPIVAGYPMWISTMAANLPFNQTVEMVFNPSVAFVNHLESVEIDYYKKSLH
jgi:hypothetical protein